MIQADVLNENCFTILRQSNRTFKISDARYSYTLNRSMCFSCSLVRKNPINRRSMTNYYSYIIDSDVRS